MKVIRNGKFISDKKENGKFISDKTLSLSNFDTRMVCNYNKTLFCHFGNSCEKTEPLSDFFHRINMFHRFNFS